MSTQIIDADYPVAAPALDARYVGFLGFLKAFAAAVSEGAQAHDDYRALTRNGIPHEQAVRKVLTHSYAKR